MGGTAVRMPDGSVQTFSNEDLPGAVAAGATPPDTVRVTLPSGAESEIPWDTYTRLNQQAPLSLTPQDSIDAQAHVADLEGDTSAAGAYGRGLLQEATFGWYKPSEDQQLADNTYHGVATTLGKGTGIVGPAMIPGLGEENVLAKGAEALEGGDIFRAGRTAAEFLPGRATAQLGAKVYEAAGGGLKGLVAGGAVEGASQDVLRSVLDRDHQLSAESVLDSAGMFALGAGVGGVAAKGAEKAGEAWERLSGKVERGLGKVDDEALVARLNENKPPTRSMEEGPEPVHARDVMANVRNDVPLFSANKALETDARKLLRQVEDWRASPLANVAPEESAIIDRGVQSLKVVGNFSKLEPSLQAKAMGAYESHLHDIDEMAAALNRAPGGLDLSKVAQRWSPQNVMARQEAVSAISAEGLSPAQVVAKRLAARLTAGTGRVAQAAPVADGLLSRIPVVGKTLSKMTAGHPLASLFLVDRALEHGVLHVAEPLAGVAAAGKLAQKAFEVPGRGIALSGLAADNLSKLGIHGQLPDERPKRAQAIADRIRRTTPDEASRMAMQAAGHVAQASPQVLAQVGATAANRHQALQAAVDRIFPQAQGALKLNSRPPTAAQVRDLERSLQIAGDPVAFLHLLAAGKLSQSDLSLARAVWPAHVGRAVRLASDWASKNQGTDIPRVVRQRLERLLGSQAVGSVHEDSARAAQASIAAAKARIHPEKPQTQPAGGHPRSDLKSPAESAAEGPGPG